MYPRERAPCVLKPGGEMLKSTFEMLHTMVGILSLVPLIRSYPEEVRVILEDTGHYHWPVVTLLVENGIFVCAVNALRMKKYKIFAKPKPTELTLYILLPTVLHTGTNLLR